MQVGGPSFTENGTFKSTDELVKNGIQPQTAFMAQIINGSIEKGEQMASAMRTSAMQSMGKGLKVDTTA